MSSSTLCSLAVSFSSASELLTEAPLLPPKKGRRPKLGKNPLWEVDCLELLGLAVEGREGPALGAGGS